MSPAFISDVADTTLQSNIKVQNIAISSFFNANSSLILYFI